MIVKKKSWKLSNKRKDLWQPFRACHETQILKILLSLWCLEISHCQSSKTKPCLLVDFLCCKSSDFFVKTVISNRSFSTNGKHPRLWLALRLFAFWDRLLSSMVSFTFSTDNDNALLATRWPSNNDILFKLFGFRLSIILNLSQNENWNVTCGKTSKIINNGIESIPWQQEARNVESVNGEKKHKLKK